ncbi:phthiocerol/phenolphthiocerol synthesis type-I polyketide synthase D [Saccharothrix saharensis]|uniref:Phthiocerol/phenolphthiocerol synthesis type-I polyketide synthase D n=1 Tax=Saccharothrix saharensis TaxID=571190 RepID=A0A543J594_9PSEU|nr:type I polyketide synthase [Saccharothrix saharensis]TQM77989.1 phthiocerol/phenolphthiocerol synthesis type-I polyketide synthase D [Saccharothrix saharensis]
MTGLGMPAEAELRAWLAHRVAELADLPEGEVDVDQPLAELGLSSRDAVVLAGSLGEFLDVPLPATVFYEHPTIARLARHLAGPSAASDTAPAGPSAEGVAVVGVGCRLPGDVDGPDRLWDFLRRGGDAVAPAPPDRWPGLPDGTPRFGGFLADIRGFDAEFFGIAPHEAALMDPQQRLVLEVSWEALHHAGIAPDALRGTRTGVYVGISTGEYGAAGAADLGRVEPWTATGGALSIAANRLSYLLDLRGPSLAVDTACSSSLVAVHHACQSLRAGETDAAVVAGVNLLLGPAVTLTFHRAGLLSADGRCKPFDAAADGIARAEGCAAVVLKRLSDARRDGDRVLAVIRGSGVNSDGRSNGLMAPNPQAQADLLRRVYADAGVDPSRVDYVEAHGTGTLLGDPIEAGALREVLGRGDGPLLIGSAKSNFGHAESAAGLVGLVKAVLAVRHGELPPSLHFHAPNPHIDFRGLRVVTAPTPWPRYSGRITAGVSSFGFGGTNAHVVLEEPPAPDPVDRPGGPAFLVVSGTSEGRVRRHAENLARWLETTHADLHDVSATLARRRGREPHAAVVTGSDRAAVVTGLRALSSGERPVDRAVRRDGAVWVFSGYGSGWAGMGRRLLAAEPVFAAAVGEVDRLIAPHSVRALLETPSDTLGDGQLALFGVQIALARLWESRGLRPAAVIGQSAGEVAAAVVSGALSLADAALVITTRARLLDVVDASGDGGMAAVELPADEVDDPALSVAVHAAPRRCTVSGPADRLAALVARVEADGGLARVLPLRTSGHSPAVEPVLAELTAALRHVTGRRGDVPLYGTVLADPRCAPPFTADYWAAHLRRPVRFTQAVTAAIEDGHTAFLEVSPHPVALPAIAEHAPDLVLVGSLRRDTDDVATFHDNLASLHLHGLGPARGVTDVPTAPWEHRPHWTAPPSRRAGHPLLGDHVELPDGTHAWQADVGLAALPWLGDHRVQDTAVLPGAAYVEMALAAGAQVTAGPLSVRDVVFESLLALTDEVPVSTTVRDGRVEVHAKTADGWVRHATATVVPGEAAGPPPPPVHSGLRPVDLYGRLADVGMDYGPAFRGVRSARAAAGAASCLVDRPDGPDRGWRLPPTLLDSCLHALAAAALDLASGGPYLPVGIGAVRLHGDPRRADRCEAVVRESGDGVIGSVWLYDDAGTLLVEVVDVRVRPASSALSGLALETRWERHDLPAADHARRTWLLLSDDRDLADALVDAGQRVTTDPAAPADGIVFGPRGLEEDLARLSALADDTRRLWIVTRNALCVRDGEAGVPDQAALRGAVRVLAFERPRSRATVVDVDDVTALPRELLADQADDEVAWRDGVRYAARLRRAEVDVPATGSAVDPAAYLITGGLGGLGLVMARWLAERGAGRIVVCGRRGPSADARAEVAKLRALGADVVVVTGDVAEPGVADRAVAAAVDGGMRLCGVVHAAGVLADAPVDRLDPADVRRVLRPKVDGALRLHEATSGYRLDWFVVFSSAAALLGSPGQAAYATANAWLDGFARWRRAAGLPATTIEFGAWSRVGLAEDNDNPLLRPLSPAEGVQAVEAVLLSGRVATGVVRFDRRRVAELFPRLARRPFFEAFLQPPSDVPEADRLSAIVARVLGGAPDPSLPLTSLGLDSLMAMRLRNAVEHDVGVRLPVPLLLRGASLRDVERHISGLATEAPARVEPRDPTERWVFGLWAEVLGRRDFGVRDDFFALGGSRERLLAAVRRRVAADGSLFTTPTVEAMAERLRAAFEDAGGPVRVLRAGGARRPLHLFHPAGGPTSVYQPLVGLLADRPCYGYERIDDVPDIPAKAARYAELVRSVQPAGPYVLGGWSFGGCLAHEVACLLQDAGAEVGPVVMIDTVRPLPAPDVTPADLVRHRFTRYARHVEEVYGTRVELPWESLSALDDEGQIDAVLAAVAGLGISPGALRHQRTSYLDARAAERYAPRHYPGRVVFYRATDRETLTTVLDPRYLRRQDDDDLGWADACGSLEVVPVPGDHLSMVDLPHVSVIARHLSSVLDD